MKKLTTESLIVFVGGQMEIQHVESRHLFRGQVKEAVVDEERYKLLVTFDWLAQGAGWPHKVTAWATVPTLVVGPIDLNPFMVFDIGKDGLRLKAGLFRDMLCFFPPNYYSNVRPEMVSGLASSIAPAA